MTMHSSARVCAETPHASNAISNQTISDAVIRRAKALVNDRTIDENARAFIRYGLEINDPGLAELVRRADAGEPIIDDSHLLDISEDFSTAEKVELLAELIYQPDAQSETRAAALLVLMSTLENSTQPKVLANHIKHIAFTCCGELNCFGMVDSQIVAIERELLARTFAR